VKEKVITYYCC